MIIKRFSATKILNTNSPGFIKGRKYDTDLDRLGRLDTQRGLSEENLNYQKEISDSARKTQNELGQSRSLSLSSELKKLNKQFK